MIECIFRVIKRKFKILVQVAEYSISTQADLILAIYSLYNFIREYEDITQELEDIEVDKDKDKSKGIKQAEAPTRS